MGYLICNECGGIYELQEGEKAEDFDKCHCGGTLKYMKKLDNEPNNHIKRFDLVADFWNTHIKNREIIFGIMGILIVLAIFVIVSNSLHEEEQPLKVPADYNSTISNVKAVYSKTSEDLDVLQNRFPSYTDEDLQLLRDDRDKLNYHLSKLRHKVPPLGFERANALYIQALESEINAIDVYIHALYSMDMEKEAESNKYQADASYYIYQGDVALLWG